MFIAYLRYITPTLLVSAGVSDLVLSLIAQLDIKCVGKQMLPQDTVGKNLAPTKNLSEPIIL